MTHLKLYNLPWWLLLLLVPAAALAQSSQSRREITKVYANGSLTSLNITNKFGNVVVKKSSNRDAKVEITITTEGNSERTAQEIMDNITIEETGAPNAVFVTNIGTIKGNNENGNRKMKVNYVVTVPAETKLNINNSFGNIDMDDYPGQVTLIQKFGDLRTGDLPNMPKVNVEFGKYFGKNVTGGNLQFKFSTVEIEKLNGHIQSSFEFCKTTRIMLGSSVSQAGIQTSYSNIEVVLPRNFSGNFDIKTNFGKLTNNTTIIMKDEEENYNKSLFRGVSGKGTVPVKINSNFGKIVLSEQ